MTKIAGVERNVTPIFEQAAVRMTVVNGGKRARRSIDKFLPYSSLGAGGTTRET